MTANELGEISGVIVEPLFAAIGLAPTPAPPALAAAAAVPVNDVYECDEDGSLNVTGDVTDGEDTFSADLTETVNGCKTMVDGVTFTLAGDPNVTLSGSGQGDSGSFSINGGFTYTTNDDRAGGCGVDVDASVSVSLTTVTVSFSGTVCGTDVSELTDDIVIDENEG